MHKRVLNPAAVERIRERIKSDRIIDALENHVLGGKEMQPSQITAALGLLKKCVPDLAAMEHSGTISHEHSLAGVLEAIKARR